MSAVPPGGPSTINGVLYQMLWTLLRTMEIHARNCPPDARSGEILGATLILEPRGGGGDLQETGESGRTVQQLKARSGGGTWSLREVVETVLPDLYLAVDLEQPETSYVFITEGRIDGWRGIHDSFFQSLGSRTPPAADVRSCLDDSKPLRVRKTKSRQRRADRDPFWSDEEYTELQLFDRIASEIRQKKGVSETDSAETIQRKLWHLLRRFSVLEKQTMASLRARIDRRLHELVDYVEDLDKVRNSLLMSLAVLASEGDIDIKARTFLADQGLRSRPFSDWLNLRRLSHESLKRSLDQLGYQVHEDVRREAARATAREWPVEKPVLLIRGGSGQGKSWRVYALAEELTSEPGLIALVDGARGLEAALREAASLVWQDFKGNDREQRLDRIAARLKESHPEQAARWLTLLIDGLRVTSDARRLANVDWAQLGIRVAVSCDEDVAATIIRNTPGRDADPVTVGNFTAEELQRYLRITIGPDWPRIPGDVRDVLRRPLLARLYREVARNKAWRYTSEYALYWKFWSRLDEDELASRPLTKMALKRLALSLLDDATYPWPDGRLHDAGMDNQAIGALVKAGWLRRAPHDSFEVWHDRLLNWAVAVSLVDAWRAQALDIQTFCERLVQVFRDERTYGGRRLEHVAIDALWLLTHPVDATAELIDAAILALEGGDLYLKERLHKRLLPALGPPILDALFRRLPQVAVSGDRLHELQIVDAITSIDSDSTAASATDLLRHDSPRVQRSAMRILLRRPSAAALDRLWTLHVQMEAEPEAFLRQNEDKYYLHEESFGALRSCVILDPRWIEKAIERADSVKEPGPIQALAYLLANVKKGGDIWNRCKPRLFRLVPPHHERSLIANIFVHGDAGEIDWVVQRVASDVDFIGPWALRTLAKLAPDLAVERLPQVLTRELYHARKWCLPELLAKRPEATRARILSMMKAAIDPWDIAFVFQDDEDSLDEAMLGVLLSDLEKRLDSDLSDTKTDDRNLLFRPLLLLSRVSRLDLLVYLERSKGTAIEEKLTEWMLREEAQSGGWKNPVYNYGIAVLQKIGGGGFTQVVNAHLKASRGLGRLPALNLAFKRPDTESIEILRSISEEDEGTPGNHNLERSYALEALAYLGHWHDVVCGVMRWGLKGGSWLEEAFLSRDPLDQAALDPAIVNLMEADAPSPGSVFALGLARWCPATEKVRSLLVNAPVDSELALACVMALGLCQDGSPETVSLIAAQLAVEKHRHQAKIALLRVGSPAAVSALLSDLRSQFDLALAIDLYQRADSREQALEVINARLASASDLDLDDLLRDLLQLSTDSAAPFLEEVRVRDHLWERAFADEEYNWPTGSKAAAIQGLGKFDRERASLAAFKAFENPDAHDRQYYPYIILELLGKQGVSMLLERAAAEKSTAVIWAIARALDGSDCANGLTDLLECEDPARRLAGCRLAERMRLTVSSVTILEALMKDPDHTVVTAAWRALGFQQATRNADELREALVSECDRSRRWILIDALLDIADPGDGHRPFPRWVDEVFGRSPALEREYVAQGLKERRRKLDKEAKERDKE
ncbi:MAG: hypothetical protein ACLP7Q_11240 [Isosphaeraceae bacterium]